MLLGMNLWKLIHRKLIDEPIERLVDWPLYKSGSLFDENKADAQVARSPFWEAIHRKLIDEPIERLVGWDQFANGSWFRKCQPDGAVSGNAFADDAFEDDGLLAYLRGEYNGYSLFFPEDPWSL